jgi:ABC-type glycerol-3-phosphate transport system permease component
MDALCAPSSSANAARHPGPRGSILGVRRELEEAAMVDGTTRFGVFVRVLLPLVGPGLVASSILAFIQTWNEYIIAYRLLRLFDLETGLAIATADVPATGVLA